MRARSRTWVQSPHYKAVVTKLVEARKSAGLTQRDLAAALGKPPSWVAKVEQRERRVDVLEFIAIARALGAKDVELFRTVATALPKRFEI